MTAIAEPHGSISGDPPGDPPTELIVPRSKRWRYGWIAETLGMLVVYQLYDLGRDRATGTTARAF